MAFDDDSFLDDYEIQELIGKFENQLRNDNLSFFDADELNIIIDYYIQHDDLSKIDIIAELAERYHSGSTLYNSIMAKKFLAVQDAINAIKYLNEDNNNTQDPDYHVNLGYCHSLLNNHQKAIVSYKKALDYLDKENCDDIYSSIGVEYMLLKEYDKALHFLKKGLDGCPDISEQYLEITNCYFNLDMSDDAVEFFKSEIDKNPHNIAAWMSLGNCYLRLHLLEKAVEQYEYALAIDQHYDTAYTNIATIFNELERYQDTIDIVEEAIRNNVKKPLLYCLYGEALHKTGKKLEAINCYNKVIEIDENVAEAYAGIAFIFCEEENHQSAIKFLEHANRLAPYNTDYLFVLVEQHNKLEEYNTSLKYLKEIEELFPYDVNLYISYMEVYIMLDDITNAIKYIEKGLQLLGRQAPLLYRMAFINFVQENEELGLLYLEEALGIDCEGVQEFIGFDPSFVLNNNNIIDLINEYKNKNNSNY